MKLILELSKENLELSRAEAELLIGKKGKLISNLLFVESNNPAFLLQRLAFTKRIYEQLFECEQKQLLKKTRSYDWSKKFKKSFSLQITNFDANNEFKNKELAGVVWNKILEKQKPRADLKNATTKIAFLFLKNKAFATLLLGETNRDYLERKAHKKPELHPTALNPKLAKAMINLTGIKKGKIYDPFCGTGGLLIEAAFMNLEAMGSDVNQWMLNKAQKNFQHYKLKNYKLKQQDAARIKHKMQYVVSDLPYGRNSIRTDALENLYYEFLINLKGLKKAVLGFPDFVDYRKILKKAKRKAHKEFTIYLHKSLSKKIVVVS